MKNDIKARRKALGWTAKYRARGRKPPPLGIRPRQMPRTAAGRGAGAKHLDLGNMRPNVWGRYIGGGAAHRGMAKQGMSAPRILNACVMQMVP